MRFTLELFKRTLDLTFGPTEVEAEPEFETYQDAGTVAGTYVGFGVAPVPWEDSGSTHQFEPDEC